MHNIPVLLSFISPRLLPPGWDSLKEPYNVYSMVSNAQAKGGAKGLAVILPPWMQKVVNGNKKFWVQTPDEIDSILEGRRRAVAKADAAKDYRQKERDEMRAQLSGISIMSRETSDLELGRERRNSQTESKDEAVLFPPPTQRQ
jgi:alcohol dehydrogenase YqhD (iron-dependent ADH family)